LSPEKRLHRESLAPE